MSELEIIEKYRLEVNYLLRSSIGDDDIQEAYQAFKIFCAVMPEEIRNLPECSSIENCFQKIVPSFSKKVSNWLTFGSYRKEIISKIISDSGVLIGKASQYFSGVRQEIERLQQMLQQTKNHYEEQISALKTEIKKSDEALKELKEQNKKLLERLLTNPVSPEVYEKRPDKPYNIIDTDHIEKYINELEQNIGRSVSIDKEGHVILNVRFEDFLETYSKLHSVLINSQFLHLRTVTESILDSLYNFKDDPKSLVNLTKAYVEEGKKEIIYYKERMREKEALQHT